MLLSPERPQLDADIVDDDCCACCAGWLACGAGSHGDPGRQADHILQAALPRSVAHQLVVLHHTGQAFLQRVGCLTLQGGPTDKPQ